MGGRLPARVGIRVWVVGVGVLLLQRRPEPVGRWRVGAVWGVGVGVPHPLRRPEPDGRWVLGVVWVLVAGVPHY